jgi:hypothetical protein
MTKPIFKQTDWTILAPEDGPTERQILESHGWVVGDVLEGVEGNHTDRILITAIGEETFLCRWDYGCKGVFGEEVGNTTLRYRDWKRVIQNEILTTTTTDKFMGYTYELLKCRTTKCCPKCGERNMMLYRTFNLKVCPCGAHLDWPLNENQKPLL